MSFVFLVNRYLLFSNHFFITCSESLVFCIKILTSVDSKSWLARNDFISIFLFFSLIICFSKHRQLLRSSHLHLRCLLLSLNQLFTWSILMFASREILIFSGFDGYIFCLNRFFKTRTLLRDRRIRFSKIKDRLKFWKYNRYSSWVLLNIVLEKPGCSFICALRTKQSLKQFNPIILIADPPK